MTSCIFDWKRTLYDPDTGQLIQGARPVLELLTSHRVPCILIGKGDPEMEAKVSSFQVRQFFQQVIFSGNEKDALVFKSFVHKTIPKSTVIIGDRTRSEIEIGNRLGTTTIWVKQGKFRTEEPLSLNQKATYTVSSLSELYALLKKRYFP
jgi:FMN phosphatase YigB (HAD superfamily)